jgi:arylsulfatase A-like enzyme
VQGTINKKSIFSAIDLVPTLLEITGTKAPNNANFDGESLPDVLLGKSNLSRKQDLLFRRPPDRDSFYGVKDLPDLAIRSGKWKLLCEYDGSDALLYTI